MNAAKLAAPLALVSLACTSAPRDAERAARPRETPPEAPATPPSGSPEDPVLSSLGALFGDARTARQDNDHAVARERIAGAIERALLEIGEREDLAATDLLEQMGLFALDAGDVRSGRKAFEHVLEVRSRTLPDDHPDLQTARSNLAIAIKTLGDLQGARALEESAVDVLSRTQSDDHPGLLRARENLAATVLRLGDLQEARTLFEKALEVRSRTLPDDHPQLQRVRSNLAAAMYLQGDLSEARALQKKVLEVRSRTLPDDHPDLQRVRSNLASTMEALGELRAARELKEKVLEVFSRTLPDDHPDLQNARQNFAVAIQALGELPEARRLFEKVLEVHARTLPEDHPDLLSARENLAGAMCRQRDLVGARELYETVLEIRSRRLPAEHPHLQRVRQGLAVTIKDLGDLPGARALEEEVLEAASRSLPDDHPDLQLARANLANTIRDLGDLAGARELEEKVLEIRSRTLDDDHPDLQLARENLAVTIRALGDLQRALELEQKVLEVRSRTLREEHPDLQRVRGNLASTMFDLGDVAGARELFEKVVEVRSRALPKDHPDLALARENLAWALVHDGGAKDRERCADLIQAVCRAQTSAAQAALLGSSTREAEARCATLSERLSSAISFARGLGILDPLPQLESAAFVLGEITRGAALTSARLRRRAAGEPRWAELSETLRRRSDELAGLVRAGATSEDFREALARREQAEKALVALARETTGRGAAGLEFDLDALARSLDPGEVAVAYRRYARWSVVRASADSGAEARRPARSSVDSLIAFVVRSDADEASDVLTCVDLGAIAPIERAVHDWRAGLGEDPGRGVGLDVRPAAGLLERGEALRRLVLDPVAPALVGARGLVLVLDDVLHLVPFDALPSGRTTEETVGDSLRIETRATLTELLEAPPRPAGTEGLVAVGDVAFGSAAREGGTGDPALPLLLRGGRFGRFAPLQATGAEVDALAESFADQGGSGAIVSILRGQDATPERLIELSPRARWLHVATHGWFASESIRSWADPEPLDRLSGLGRRLSGEDQVKGMSPMLLCGLALAGANAPESEAEKAPGLITAEEISSLDLSNCELAVLSACDTNVGERRAGQGVHSLQMALQMAGARSVITSLWKVPDEATRDLMIDFYRGLWVDKKTKRQALWDAKKKLREARNESGGPKHSTRDWGAWVLTGDPD